MIVAIDGPAGAGKSTVARELARRLGLPYLESGVLYRAIAREVLDRGIGESPDRLHRWLEGVRIEALWNGCETVVKVDGEEVGGELRSEEVSSVASRLSADRFVREKLLAVQQAFGARSGCVAEGRDISTVVFPDADRKFYLDAELEERARRRYNFAVQGGYPANLEKIREETEQRNTRDATREIAPLRQARDAVYINSTGMTVEEVIALMLEKIR